MPDFFARFFRYFFVFHIKGEVLHSVLFVLYAVTLALTFIALFGGVVLVGMGIVTFLTQQGFHLLPFVILPLWAMWGVLIAFRTFGVCFRWVRNGIEGLKHLY